MEKRIRTVGIVANLGKEGISRIVRSLCAKVTEKKARILCEPAVKRSLDLKCARGVQAGKLAGSSDVLFSLGGDGTLLYAAKLARESDTPILGVNLGKLGFMKSVNPGEIPEAVDGLFRGAYRVEKRAMIQAEVRAPGRKPCFHYALNDIVISRGDTGRVVELETFIDGSYLTSYKADGLIVATPTGSTAYALSVGGPVLQASLKAMVIAPISPHTLSNRPLVVSEKSTLSIRIPRSKERLLLVVDGRLEQRLAYGTSVIAGRSLHAIQLLVPPRQDNWMILRNKLGWQEL